MEKIRMIMVTDFSTKFHKIGLWILIAFLAGTIVGNFYSERLIDKRLNDSVTHKAIKIGDKEYDLKERI